MKSGGNWCALELGLLYLTFDFLGIRYVLKAIAKSRKLSEHAATLITAWRFP